MNKKEKEGIRFVLLILPVIIGYILLLPIQILIWMFNNKSFEDTEPYKSFGKFVVIVPAGHN